MDDAASDIRAGLTRRGAYRFVVYALILVMGMASYSDRAVLSVCMPSIAKDFHLGAVETGWVLSSFLWTYFVLHFPSARIADRLGPRLMGALSCMTWSGAMLLGAGATTSFAFLLSRALLGAGESPVFSLTNRAACDWAPARERGAAATMSMIGLQVGLAVGAWLGGVLMRDHGWRTTFAVLGVAGVAWAAVWWAAFREPAGVRKVSVARIGQPADLRRLLAHPSFWGIALPQSAAGFSNFLFMSWTSIYLMSRFGLTSFAASEYFALCYALSACLSLGLSIGLARLVPLRNFESGQRRFVVAALLAGASVVVLLPSIASLPVALLVIAVVMALTLTSWGENAALVGDVTSDTQRVASVYGATMTMSSGLGIAAPVIAGYIFAATRTFDSALYGAGGLLLLGAGLSLFLPRRPIG